MTSTRNSPHARVLMTTLLGVGSNQCHQLGGDAGASDEEENERSASPEDFSSSSVIEQKEQISSIPFDGKDENTIRGGTISLVAAGESLMHAGASNAFCAPASCNNPCIHSSDSIRPCKV
eukprot:57683-Rhodomonas_salina.3